jgi:phosphoribosylanthranilate isomerase
MNSDIKIKVCGMRQAQNIKELIQLTPDYIGFIFYPKSPRFAGEILDSKVTFGIPANIKKTGVFVNSDLEYIIKTCEKFKLNTVQLHGKESKNLCQNIKNHGYEVIKAFSIKSDEEINKITDYNEDCDFFLFDTPTAQYGGSGRKFDWSLLANTKIEKPFFLSGGIEENDAKTILNACPVKPYAIDINSRFEVAPGLKNIESVARFINEIRNVK